MGNGQNLTDGPERRPRIYNETASRQMKSFLVTEPELDSLAQSGLDQTQAFSLGSGMAGAALSAFIAGNASAWAPGPWLAGALVIASAAFFGWGWKARKVGSSVLQKITTSFTPPTPKAPRARPPRPPTISPPPSRPPAPPSRPPAPSNRPPAPSNRPPAPSSRPPAPPSRSSQPLPPSGSRLPPYPRGR